MKLCKFALGVVALAVSASSLAGIVTTSLKLTKHNRLWYV